MMDRIVSRVAPVAFLLLLLVVALGATACSRTPEERLEAAIEKLSVEQPPDIWGASSMLRQLAKDEEAPTDIRTHAYVLLAQIEHGFQKLDEAEALLSDAIALNEPSSAEWAGLVSQRMMLLAQLGKPAEAAQLAAEALEQGKDQPVPTRTSFRIRRGGFLSLAGEKEQARAIFEELLTEYDDPQVNTVVLEQLIATYLPDEPLAAAERYIAYAEANPDTDLGKKALFGAGFFLHENGQEEKAKAYLDTYFAWAKAEIDAAIDRREQNDAVTALLRSYEQLRMYPEMIETLQRGRELMGEEDVTNYASMTAAMLPALIELDRRDEAFAELRSIMEKFPESEQAKMVPQLLANLEANLAEMDRLEAEAAAQLGLDAEGEVDFSSAIGGGGDAAADAAADAAGGAEAAGDEAGEEAPDAPDATDAPTTDDTADAAPAEGE